MHITALLFIFRVQKMASHSQSDSCASNTEENDRSDPREWPWSNQNEKLHEHEYDFIEDVPQEFFCPVTFELLRDPQLTTCCGHLLSRRVVTKLQQEGKPCPICKDPGFPSVPNKHFKRKVEELKVRCSYERNGCKWEGELGNLDHHSNSCPKRPWQCQHCDFRGTYDIGITDHLPNCTKYPEPCPNRCDIGTVPRCDMEKHLNECPLQLVKCEFAQAGCQERIPRQDMPRHMEEGAQRHLLNMSLLNLSLTRELHLKMAEKDQQIAELHQQIFGMQTQLQNVLLLQGGGIHALLQNCKQIPSSLLMSTGFTQSFEFTLRAFSMYVALGGSGEWLSKRFFSHPGGYNFQLSIHTRGYGEAQGTHISADLYRECCQHESKLSWPIQVTAHLQLLNQQGDHGHIVGSCGTLKFDEEVEDMYGTYQTIANKFIANSELGYNVVKNTQYLKDDCLHFRLYLKVA